MAKFRAESHYLTAFLRLLPGVNPGALRAAIVIVSPVFGFLPFLVFLDLKEKVPNPVITTFSSRLSESRIALRKTRTASFDALFVRFAFLATSSINSFFVTDKLNHLRSGWIDRINDVAY